MNIIWTLKSTNCWWAWDLDITPVPTIDTPIDAIAIISLPVLAVKIRWPQPGQLGMYREYDVSYMTLEDAKSFAEVQYCLMK